MFDWVEDALGWIENAVSSAWESAFTTTVNEITETVFKAFFEWTYGMIYEGIAAIFEYINGTPADIFNLALGAGICDTVSSFRLDAVRMWLSCVSF